MKSQSNQYPVISQYSENEIAVPINIQQKEHPENGTSYEFDLIILPMEEGATVKDDLYMAISKYHDLLVLAGCPTSFGFRIDCESTDVVNWMGSLQLLQLSGATEITICDYDNVNHVMSAADFTQMCGELGAYLMGLRTKKWQIREAIQAAETDTDAYAAAKWD